MRMSDIFKTWCFVFAVSIGICQARCPDAWINFDSSCYLFAFDIKPFTEAEHFCLQQKAHLVKIDSVEESKFLKSRCQELKEYPRWIGLTDANIEGIWKWTADDSSLGFSDWDATQPDGQHGSNCAAMWVADHYLWKDEPCIRPLRLICEKPDTACTDEVVG